MPILVSVVRAQSLLLPHVTGGLIPVVDGRHKPNLPDGVLKAIGKEGLGVRLSPHAHILAEVDTATRSFVQSLVEADQMGGDVSPAMDEYFRRCGNEPWPLPRGWRKPWWLLPAPGDLDPSGKPQPIPWLTQQMRVIVALTVTELGDQLGSDLGSELIDRADRLFESATAAG